MRPAGRPLRAARIDGVGAPPHRAAARIHTGWQAFRHQRFGVPHGVVAARCGTISIGRAAGAVAPHARVERHVVVEELAAWADVETPRA